ncbi:MAG TPA: cytochrome c [Gammaproteobacteria bacterium]
MKSSSRVLGLLAAAGAAAYVGAVLPALAQSGAPDPEIGKQLFYEHGCYGCHGFNGETGVRDLVATNSPIIADVDAFITYLRLRGDQAPLLPSTRMPNYPESALSDEEARHIYAYVSSFKLHAPEVEDVPTLQAIIESASRPYEPQR